MTSTVAPVEQQLDPTPQQTRCRHQKSASIAIERDADDVYCFLRRMSNIPSFMSAFGRVVEPMVGTTLWARRLAGGTLLTWEAEITCDYPGSRIAWRSFDASAPDEGGSFRLISSRDRTLTEIQATIEYEGPRGTEGLEVASLFRADPGGGLPSSLRALKSMLERHGNVSGVSHDVAPASQAAS